MLPDAIGDCYVVRMDTFLPEARSLGLGVRDWGLGAMSSICPCAHGAGGRGPGTGKQGMGSGIGSGSPASRRPVPSCSQIMWRWLSRATSGGPRVAPVRDWLVQIALSAPLRTGASLHSPSSGRRRLAGCLFRDCVSLLDPRPFRWGSGEPLPHDSCHGALPGKPA